MVSVEYFLPNMLMSSYTPDTPSKLMMPPLETKAGHRVEVIGSYRHLPLGDMKGVGSVPPPLNEALHQGGTRRLF